MRSIVESVVRRLWIGIALVSLLGAGGQAESAEAPMYPVIQDLGTLGGSSSFGYRLHDSAAVVGNSPITGTDPRHAFLWRNGILSDLGTLGGVSSFAAGINEAGQVAGWAATARSESHAFLWTREGGMRDLGTLGGVESNATSINDAGHVVGTSDVNARPVRDSGVLSHAFLWTATGGMRDLGTLGGSNSGAFDINATGQVVGMSLLPGDSYYHAFLWSPDTGMRDLGTLGGPRSQAASINAGGEVVGGADTSGGFQHACRWAPGGSIEDLGALPGDDSSYATSINVAGQIVGYSYTAGQREVHPFVYTRTAGMVDLNTLIDPALHLHLESAWSINATGQIVATGTQNGESHGFLLMSYLALPPSGKPRPPTRPRLLLSTDTLVGGGSFEATVFLDGPAPPGGLKLQLSSDTPVIASGPTVWPLAEGEVLFHDPIGTEYVKTLTTVHLTLTCDGASDTQTLTLLPSTAQAPAAPSDLRFDLDVAAFLHWKNNSPDASSIEIERRDEDAANPEYHSIAIVRPEITSYIDPDPAPHIAHSYRVRASRGLAYSSYTNEAGGIPLSVAVTTLTPDVGTVLPGSSATETITLSAPAPKGGAVIQLSSDSPGVASVPESVTVPPGETQATFDVTTHVISGPRVVMVTAAYAGASRSALLTVGLPPRAPTDLTVSAPTATSVTLAWVGNDPLASGYEIERRTAGTPFTVVGGTGPGTLTYTDTNLQPNTHYLYRIRAISWGAGSGYSTETSGETISEVIDKLTLIPSTIQAGASGTGFILLTGPKPNSSEEIALSSSDPNVVTVPKSVGVPPDSDQTTFPFKTSVVRTPTMVTITATYRGTAMATLQIDPGDIAHAPSDLVVGHATFHELTLTWTNNDPSADGIAIERRTESSDFGQIGEVWPGATTYTDQNLPDDTLYTYRLRAIRHGVPTAYSNEVSAATRALWTPSLAIYPETIVGGRFVTATVVIPIVAPKGGIVIALLSDNVAVAPVPATVTIPEGKSEETIAFQTQSVSAPVRVTVSAVYLRGQQSTTATLTLVPDTHQTPPAAPSDLQLTLESASDLELTWTDNSADETAFEIEFDTGSGTFTRFFTVPAAAGVGSTVHSGSLTFSRSPADSIRFRVRAINPAGASDYSNVVATLSTPLRLASVTFNKEFVQNGAYVIATVTLSRPAPGEMQIALSTDSPDAVLLPDSMTINAGATEGTFLMEVRPVPTAQEITVTARYGKESQEGKLKLVPPPLPVTPGPLRVGKVTDAEITLTWDFPNPNTTGFELERHVGAQGDLFVHVASLSRNTTSYTDQSLPPQTLYTYRLRAVGIAGPSEYSSSVWAATLPLSGSFTVDPDRVWPGSEALGTIALDRAAPEGGIEFTLSSDDPAVTLPPSVTLAAGATAVTFPVKTAALYPDWRAVNLLATFDHGGMHGGMNFRLLLYGPPTLDSVTLDTDTVLGGGSATGTVSLNGPAPPGGVVVSAANPNLAVAFVPPGVTVPAGKMSATFTIATQPVAQATPIDLQISYNGQSRSVRLTVLPPVVVAAVTVNPDTIASGSSASGKVTLSAPAPTGGATVLLQSDNPAVVSVPASVTVPAGTSSASFPIAAHSVAAATSVEVTAVFGGVSRVAIVKLLPPSEPPAPPTNLRLENVGQTQITLSWADNSATETGFEIERRTPDTLFRRIWLLGPGATTFTDGSLAPDHDYSYRVRAINSAGASAYSNEAGGHTLPAGLAVVTLSPDTLTGGDTSTGTVSLNGPAPPGGAIVLLTSGDPLRARVLRSVLIPEGTTWATFIVTTAVVKNSTAVTIAANYAGETQSATLTLLPSTTLGSTVSLEHPTPGIRHIAVMRPSTHEWFLRQPDGSPSVIQWGGADDLPVPADYLGAGQPQIAVMRPATHEWFIHQLDGGAMRVQWGGLGDLPVPADYVGTGRAQIAVLRPSTHEWFIRRDDGTLLHFQFGGPEDVPVPADYFGVGRAQIAVYRPSTSEWFLLAPEGGAVRYQWGGWMDRPVPGDYLGEGKAQIAIYRPSTSEFFIRKDSGQVEHVQFGMRGDEPVSYDYSDAGKLQIGIYRPGTAEWFLRKEDGGATLVPWGGWGDQPVPGAFSPH